MDIALRAESAQPTWMLGAVHDGNVDEHGLIVADVACRRCGYNLRGLSISGACPKCGAATGLSTFGSYLRYGDPDWVEKIARGAELILYGIVAYVIGGCAGGAVMAITRSELGGQLIILAAATVTMYGTWLLTTPDPGHVGEDRFALVRKLVRASIFLGLSLWFVALLISSRLLPPAVVGVLGVITLVGSLFSLLGQFLYMLYIEHLFTRVPDERQAKNTRTLRWIYVITVGIMVAVSGFARLGPAARGFELIALAITAVGGIVALVCGILFIIVLVKFRRALRDQAVDARNTWAATARTAIPQ
jgi:hypothetical protein